MKKYFIIIILFLIIFMPIWMYVWWKYSGIKPINILIVDKTVLVQPAQEHSSINWVLKNEQYVKWDSTHYDIARDYMGFYPFKNKKYYTNGLEKRDTNQINLLAENIDAAYIADCYGIYRNDWYDGDVREYSKIIYGGMHKNDVYLMKKLVAQKKLLIAEFNCMASPTPKNVKAEFEELYAIKWTGWIGRYFDELDSNKNVELPRWAIRNYDRFHKDKWDFSGQGIVLVNESGRVEVLEDRRHLNGVAPNIISNEAEQKRFGIPEEMRYPFWFEINLSSRKNNVISVYKLNTNSLGDSILSANNILKVFPAVIERRVEGKNMFYFAGDFADNPIDYNLSKFKKIEWLKNLSINTEVKGERESFFYDFYLPMMRTILDDYYSKLPKDKVRSEIPIYRF